MFLEYFTTGGLLSEIETVQRMMQRSKMRSEGVSESDMLKTALHLGVPAEYYRFVFSRVVCTRAAHFALPRVWFTKASFRSVCVYSASDSLSNILNLA